MMLPGCPSSPPPPPAPSLHTEPLPIQQAKAYPETVTGHFVSLADFEDSPSGRRGKAQAEHFAVEPADRRASIRFVYNVTRTGAGALEVTLPPQRELIFHTPQIHDFRKYTLLSLAVHSPALRDDLQVTLGAARGAWASPRTLVSPGWNNVLIDLRAAQAEGKADLSAVQTVRLSFADALSPVTFYLDDLMLIQNERAIEPTPSGLKVGKAGLSYRISAGAEKEPLELSRSPDGLWRWNRGQPKLQLLPPGELPQDRDENLDLMSPRKAGQVTLLENNALRVRLGNAWYFPSRAGEWSSSAVRQIRWEYTFYGDGRWVTRMEVNNSGGKGISLVRALFPEAVAMAGRGVSRELAAYGLGSDVGRWAWLAAPAGSDKELHEQAYLKPGAVTALLADPQAYAPGDADRDRFDESHGCYFLAARNGHCRFRLDPPKGGLMNPVFQVSAGSSSEGKPLWWQEPVSVNMEGQVLRQTVLAGENLLLTLPGKIDRSVVVEVLGKQGDESVPSPLAR